ncbi:MAG TPA: EF-hand domain-containing protein [Sphingomicrobium sp.]|nr:EF-hand domain-containing protein [Sphingomicrobium sp.]
MIRASLTLLALLAAAPLFAQDAPKQLPRARFQALMLSEFKQVDANNDGDLSRSEFEASQKAAIEARVQARNNALFARLDSDKNGQISAAEFASFPASAPRPDATAFLRLDSNKDGKVSAAEHAAGTTANFNRIDSNKDGTVSAAEAKASQGR